MHTVTHAAVGAGNDVFPADCGRRTRSLSSTRERISADAVVVLRAARGLLQAEPGGFDRRNPALVIGFHQRGQLCRRQFRSVQAKFIEPALHRLRPDGFEEDAIQLRHDKDRKIYRARKAHRLVKCHGMS